MGRLVPATALTVPIRRRVYEPKLTACRQPVDMTWAVSADSTMGFDYGAGSNRGVKD
jgi:hypothetical protein